VTTRTPAPAPGAPRAVSAASAVIGDLGGLSGATSGAAVDRPAVGGAVSHPPAATVPASPGRARGRRAHAAPSRGPAPGAGAERGSTTGAERASAVGARRYAADTQRRPPLPGARRACRKEPHR
jgi:hypothetical protein